MIINRDSIDQIEAYTIVAEILFVNFLFQNALEPASPLRERIINVPSTSRGILPTPEKAVPSKWRKSNIERRLKVKRRIKRNLGYSYINNKGKDVVSREIGHPCQCKNKCRTLLMGQESKIFEAFWDLADYNKQNVYLFSSMKSVSKKRSYPKKTKRRESSRKVTIQYFIKINGVDVKVCKIEFLAVHGLQKSQKRIQLLCQQMSEGLTTPRSDRRGKHNNRPNKISDHSYQNVKAHIEAIPKYVSHYSRKNNPKRVYLDHELSISSLYKDHYIDWCRVKNIQPVSEDKYRRIFCTSFNIGFKLPKSDTCKTCDYLNLQIDDHKNNVEKLNKLKFELELHQRRSEAMQKNLSEEAEAAKLSGLTSVISFDLQQALPVPNLTVGPAFYLRKAWTYNLGIHDCVTGLGYMYMWPENVGKRGSDEIASILYKHFKINPPTTKKLIVFTDNCGGQNKNWGILCLWQQLVKEGIFECIEHRFLTVGHTHLPSDRDFALIEKYKRNRVRQVYVPEDWYEAVKNSKRTNPFHVTVLNQEDIFSFRELQSQIVKKNMTDNKEKLKFSKICCFKFTSANPNILFIKHLLNEEYKSVNIGKKGSRKSILLSRDLKKKYDGPIPLNSKKIQNLNQLIQYIPPIYYKYYEDIGVTINRAESIREANEESTQEIQEVENIDDFSESNSSEDEA